MNTQATEDQDIEIEEGTLTLLDGNEALTAVDRASIDIQIATAKQYPRSVTRSLREAETLATLDEETAGSCFYTMPRAGKRIEGPSVRLAEIMGYTWGNLRIDAGIQAQDRTHVTAVGTCFDLEKNVAIRVQAKRRITHRNGNRYNEDMIGITENAAISIVLRNAVFRVIPAAFVRRIYLAARSASLGDGTMEEKRTKALEWFADMDVKEQQVYDLLEIDGRDDLGEDELITLRGLVTAIKDGDTTVAQAFSRHDVSDGSDELNEALADPQGETSDSTTDSGGDQPTESIGRLEEQAGVGKADREAICKRLGIKSPINNPDAYCAHLNDLIAKQQEQEA